jgi:hypothetical protein
MVTAIPARRSPFGRIPENRVLEIWQSTIQRRPDLITEEYGPVRIIYPGRPNDGRGADLRDAVIATGHGVIKGDIEIHVKSSDWRAHGHHRDPAYNQVILHVVLQNDAGTNTILQDGTAIPTLALDSFAEIQLARRVSSAFTPVLAPGCKANPEAAARLDSAGEVRFLSKAAEFENEISRVGSAETLYRGIMTALGYSKNKEPMAALAGLMPLPELEEVMAGAEPDNACLARLQSRLLGTAGLLPSQRRPQRLRLQPSTKSLPQNPPDAYEIELEQLWRNHRPVMLGDAWHFFKVRPGNAPVRRITAMSYLLVRFRKQGILLGLQDALANDVDGRALEQALFIRAEDYWERYMDFGIPVTGKAPALIGGDRAAEIIINVILPFFAAYGSATGQMLLSEKAPEFFRCYRPPPENSLEKHMRNQLGIPPELAATAQRRQGLIHVYKTFCTQGKCGVCPLSGDRERNTTNKYQ